MVETKKEMESVYRLHIMRKMHGGRHTKIVKAVIRLPKMMSEEELLLAMMRWKAEQPREQLSIANRMGIVRYSMKDILSFQVKPYQNPQNGERQLILDEVTRQNLLQ